MFQVRKQRTHDSATESSVLGEDSALSHHTDFRNTSLAHLHRPRHLFLRPVSVQSRHVGGIGGDRFHSLCALVGMDSNSALFSQDHSPLVAKKRQRGETQLAASWRLLQCPAMNIATILAQLKAERDQMDRAITALEHVTGSSNRASRPRTRRRISAEGLARIRAAQKARWAKARGQKKVASIQSAKAGKRTMSASARRKIAAAQRARWAKLKRRKRNAGDDRAARL